MSRQSCKCKKCVKACETRPCWGTPEDAQKLIDAGYADRLMDDYWVAEIGKPNIHLLCPAVEGYEGGPAPEPASFMDALFAHNMFGTCTFLTMYGECELHDKKLKPLEGRRAWLCKEPRDKAYERHRRCAMKWDNEEAQALVKRWRKLVKKKRRKKAS